MNLVRSIMVPQTMASDTAQKTNWNIHFADAGTVLAAMAGRSRLEPGLKVGAKPLNPMIGNSHLAEAPKARANPIAQYTIEAVLKFVITLATTVPTFFMRLKPTSSMAKPACMNMTKTAATTTHTVSAPPPAACVAVLSSAASVCRGVMANRTATTQASRSLSLMVGPY